MKRKILRLTKWLTLAAITASLVLSVAISSYADEENGENIAIGGEIESEISENIENSEENSGENPQSGSEGGESDANIFDEIYSAAEENADKIFSVLAFIGTLVVGVGYKSGLMPLLSDALSKLKTSIDGVKADGELNKAITESKMGEIFKAVESMSGSLSEMKYQKEGYDQLLAERKAMRRILLGQIDMLYAIFMSSALPQYQKDEIGIKIQEMREELASYENILEE